MNKSLLVGVVFGAGIATAFGGFAGYRMLSAVEYAQYCQRRLSLRPFARRDQNADLTVGANRVGVESTWCGLDKLFRIEQGGEFLARNLRHFDGDLKHGSSFLIRAFGNLGSFAIAHQSI